MKVFMYPIFSNKIPLFCPLILPPMEKWTVCIPSKCPQCICCPRVITDPEWLPARSGPPVLFLPDTRRTVVAKLRLLLQEGEVSFGCRPRELEELEELLGMLQVSAAVQVKQISFA